jgi:hypothetical protein
MTRRPFSDSVALVYTPLAWPLNAPASAALQPNPPADKVNLSIRQLRIQATRASGRPERRILVGYEFDRGGARPPPGRAVALNSKGRLVDTPK